MKNFKLIKKAAVIVMAVLTSLLSFANIDKDIGTDVLISGLSNSNHNIAKIKGNTSFSLEVPPVTDCVAPMDLNTWQQEGNLSNGNWAVSTDGKSLTQTINGEPTMFVSPDDYINTTVEGEFGVQTSSDDDFIGFVLGYQSPNNTTANNDYDMILFDWKQFDQTYQCAASRGMRLRRVTGVPSSVTGAFWCSTDPVTTVLATNTTIGGWQNFQFYNFKVDYTETNIKIWIDNVLVFDVNGQFSSGKFGFYNYSQAQTVYRNFSIPFKTFINKTDSSCPNTADGSAEAIPSTNIGPFTYVWSNGATTKVATGLTPGTYTVNVYASNNCHSSESVTIESPPDTTPPEALTKDITVQLDAGGNAIIIPEDVDDGSNDACGIQSLALSQTEFDCSHLGANTVTLTVTDYNGNFSTNTATVTVEVNVVAGTISGVDELCIGYSETFEAVGGNAGGIWSSSNPAVASINSSTGEAMAHTSGSTTIKYEVESSCGTFVETTKTLTVNATVSIGNITFNTQAQIDAFEATYGQCTTINGNMTINGSDITNLDGLSSVQNIGGNLVFQSNTLLSNTDGLSSLQSVGGILWISFNSQLINLDGLSALQSVGSHLYIYRNLELTNIDGLSSLESVGGYLQIDLNAQLTNINGLSGVQTTGSYLLIQNNSSLTNINGFDALQSIGTYLSIQYNHALTNIDGLTSVQGIGTYLSIHNNQALTNINGLSAVQSIGGHLRIFSNSNLTHINGLSAVQSMDGSLFLHNNPLLVDITGLSNIDPATISGTGLFIQNNSNLSVCNLPNICEYLNYNPVDFPRTISGNAGGCLNTTTLLAACVSCAAPTALTTTNVDVQSVDLSWLTGDEETQWEVNYGTPGFNPDTDGTLETVNNDSELILFGLTADTSYEVYVRAVCDIDDESSWAGPVSFTTLKECPIGIVSFTSQAQIDAFGVDYAHCTTITSNLIINGGDITNLNGLSSLQSIGGNLTFQSNTLLTNSDGLSSLLSVGGNLWISFNSELTNLDGLSSVQSVGGLLRIALNSKLANIDGLSSIQNVGGYLYIYRNHQLTNIDGLSSLQTVGGYLGIEVNNLLTNIDGLSLLQSVGGYLSIEDNNILPNLNGLSALQSIDGYLYVVNNGLLNDISGLSDINPTTISGTGLFIENNPSLTVCDLPNLCTYLSDPANPRSIFGNAGNCFDETVVIAACMPVPPPVSDLGWQIAELNTHYIIDFENTVAGVNEGTFAGAGFSPTPGPGQLNSNTFITGGWSDAPNSIGFGATSPTTGDFARGTNAGTTATGGVWGFDVDTGNRALGIKPGGTDFTPGFITLRLQNQTGQLIGGIMLGYDILVLNNQARSNSFNFSYSFDNINFIPVGGLDLVSPEGADSDPSWVSNLRSTSITNIALNPEEFIYLRWDGDDVSGSGNRDSFALDDIEVIAYASCDITGDLIFNSQAQLDAFAVAYAHCTEITITGNLTIQGFDISDLSPLQKLTSIGGILNINQNFFLTSLAGLENIDPTSITNLIIYENFDLSLCSLPNICEYLSFDPVDFPRNISINAGNCSDEYAVGALCIPDCDIPGTLTFYSQAALNDFVLISAHCTEITISGNLTIQGFDINDLTPLQKIISIGGTLDILNNAQLQNLHGLDNVTSIGGNLNIYNNPALTTIDGLSGVTSIGGSFSITSNQALANINGFSSLTSIGEFLSVSSNQALTNINGLSDVTGIVASLFISNNHALTNLNGLAGVTNIEGSLTISNNQELTNINGLSGITSIGAELQITNNPILTDIDGLSAVTIIEGYLQIEDNQTLTTIDGLSGVTSIDGSLSIWNNDTLTNLDGFLGIISINGDIYIGENANLNDISGLANINSATIGGFDGLYIESNPNLAVCNLPNFCEYLSNPAGTHPRTISDNLAECINEAAVLKACFPCPEPTDFVADPIDDESVDLSWQAGDAETQWEVNYGTPGFNPDTDGISETVNNNPELTLHGLTANTSYEVYVRAVCDIDDESSWTGPVSFTTLEACEIAECVENKIVDSDMGDCFYTHSGIAWDAEIDQNCSIETIDYELTGDTNTSGFVIGNTLDGIQFNVGVTTVTWRITYVNTNVDTCSFTVTVQDNELPDAIAKDITIQLDASGNASITPEDIDDGSDDACGIASLTLDITSFDCSNTGPNTVTLTVTDNNGNENTVDAIVTVEDKEDPTILVKNFTLQLDNTGNGVLMVSEIDNGSYDNCSIVTSVLSKTTFTCTDEGENLVTMTGTDAAGNLDSANATVTVLLPINPITVNINSTVAPNGSNNVVIFSGADASLGLPSSTTLSAAGIPTTYTDLTHQWFWRSIPSGTFQSSPISTSPSIDVNASGDFEREYKLVLLSSSGCIAENKLSLISVETSCGNLNSNIKRVQVCMVTPNGNPKTICVNANAVDAMLTAHSGSYVGSCSISYQTSSQTQEGSFLEVASWPNPSNDMFSILVESSNTAEPIHYTVFDIAGRYVEESTGKVGETFMVGDRYSTGVYMVKVSQGSTARFIKLVKK